MAIPQRDGRRPGKAAINTGVARFLASDEACLVCAIGIPVDGGRSQVGHD